MNITVITFPLSANSNYKELIYFKLNIQNFHNPNYVLILIQTYNIYYKKKKCWWNKGILLIKYL